MSIVKQPRFEFPTAIAVQMLNVNTRKPLENAHSAMADVQGCMAVYFAVQDLEFEAA